MGKKILIILLGILVAIGVTYVWHVNFNYRFEVIDEGKVYKSALIPPKKLGSYLEKYHIKTVIDLLDGGVQDDLNPAKYAHIQAEDKAIKEFNKTHNANVLHVNIPSRQIPTKKTLTEFFKILDNPKNYPVLIHCYHGTGRAPLYSAIYRIEYKGWKPKDARDKIRLITEFLWYKSSFADSKKKGAFLINYKPRNNGKSATIHNIK